MAIAGPTMPVSATAHVMARSSDRRRARAMNTSPPDVRTLSRGSTVVKATKETGGPITVPEARRLHGVPRAPEGPHTDGNFATKGEPHATCSRSPDERGDAPMCTGVPRLPQHVPRDGLVLPADGRETRRGGPRPTRARLCADLRHKRGLHAAPFRSPRSDVCRLRRDLRAVRAELRTGRSGGCDDARLRRGLPALRRVVPEDGNKGEGRVSTRHTGWERHAAPSPPVKPSGRFAGVEDDQISP